MTTEISVMYGSEKVNVSVFRFHKVKCAGLFFDIETLTLRRAYSAVAILGHSTYCTHCHLCPTRYSFTPQVEHACDGKVPFPRIKH